MYFRNRYYSTDRGSFVTRDPKRYADGFSIYLEYFGADGVDPSGLREFTTEEIFIGIKLYAEAVKAGKETTKKLLEAEVDASIAEKAGHVVEFEMKKSLL